jgi:hypothetical protein
VVVLILHAGFPAAGHLTERIPVVQRRKLVVGHGDLHVVKQIFQELPVVLREVLIAEDPDHVSVVLDAHPGSLHPEQAELLERVDTVFEAVLQAAFLQVLTQPRNGIHGRVGIPRREVPRYRYVAGIAQDEECAIAGGLGNRQKGRIADVQVSAYGAFGQRPIEFCLLQA